MSVFLDGHFGKFIYRLVAQRTGMRSHFLFTNWMLELGNVHQSPCLICIGHPCYRYMRYLSAENDGTELRRSMGLSPKVHINCTSSFFFFCVSLPCSWFVWLFVMYSNRRILPCVSDGVVLMSRSDKDHRTTRGQSIERIWEEKQNKWKQTCDNNISSSSSSSSSNDNKTKRQEPESTDESLVDGP